MTSWLHLVALFPAAVSLAATAAGRRGGRLGDSVLSLFSLTAMADHALSLSVLPPLLWTGILLSTAMIAAGIGRFRRAHAPGSALHSSCHEQVGLVVMGLLIAGSSMHASMPTGGHHAGVNLAGLAALASCTFAIATWAAAIRRDGTSRIALTAMGASMALMSVASLV